MTWKVTGKKDNRATARQGRQTPKDVENEKYGIHPSDKTKEPYIPTAEENRANKLASEFVSAQVINISSWKDFIWRELAEMNLGKVGRPYEYCDSMFMWILMVLGDTAGTFSKVTGIAREILESHGIKAPSISTVHRRLIKLAKGMIRDAPRRIPV